MNKRVNFPSCVFKQCDECGSEDVRVFSGPGKEWECERCSKRVEQIHGCVSCARVVCDSCVQYYGEATLEYISGFMGVTRERVRQLEGRALRKLRERLRFGLGQDPLSWVTERDSNWM